MSILRSWREAAARRAEIEAVTDAELVTWGLSREEFRALATMAPERLARLEAMAAIHGVSEAVLGRDVRVRNQAALECARCRDLRLCTRMIADWAEPAEMTFCPNHEALTRLAGA